MKISILNKIEKLFWEAIIAIAIGLVVLTIIFWAIALWFGRPVVVFVEVPVEKVIDNTQYPKCDIDTTIDNFLGTGIYGISHIWTTYWQLDDEFKDKRWQLEYSKKYKEGKIEVERYFSSFEDLVDYMNKEIESIKSINK